MALRFITVPPLSLCTSAQQLLQALALQANSRPLHGSKNTSPEPSSNGFCGRRLDRSTHRTREARTDTAPRHQRILFL